MSCRTVRRYGRAGGAWGAAEPRRRGRGAGGSARPAGTSLPFLCLPQGCRIYLCGTKSDLLEEDRRKRGVDFHDVQDYADGTAGHHTGPGCSRLGSAGPSQAPTAPSGWGVRVGMELLHPRAPGRREGLCPCPGSAADLAAPGARAPCVVRSQACPDTGAGAQPAGPRGRERGALPWAPTSSLSAAVPEGRLPGGKLSPRGHILQLPTWAFISEIKAELFETSSKTGQSVGE